MEVQSCRNERRDLYSMDTQNIYKICLRSDLRNHKHKIMIQKGMITVTPCTEVSPVASRALRRSVPIDPLYVGRRRFGNFCGAMDSSS
jgi:hypothetical protein